MVDNYLAETLTAVAFVLIATAEFLHYRRCSQLASLAFGPEGKPRQWTFLSPALRVVAVCLLTWGFTILMELRPKVFEERELSEQEYRRAVILLDVSPSMWAKDGGKKKGEQTRGQRGAVIMESLVDHLYKDDIRFSIVAFYTGALTVIRDTRDPDVVLNVVNDLPLTFAFEGGKTDLVTGIKHTFEMAKEWPDRSTTVIMVTDGDTIPDEGMPKKPASISNFLVVGVGDSRTGTFVHEHQSRQDSATLRQLASRLGGHYQNVNEKHLSTSMIEKLTADAKGEVNKHPGLREAARLAILAGALILILLPVLLEYAGCRFKGRRHETRRI